MLSALATVDVSTLMPWPNSDGKNDIFIDPNCDPKLVIRQLEEEDEKPNCPCCFSRDGGDFLPYQTPVRPTRTALATTSFTVEHSLWQATATIRGEPVPTSDKSDEPELELCMACSDGLCSLAFDSQHHRRQSDDELELDEDSDEWPAYESDGDDDGLAFSEDEDQDRTSPNDILKTSLTHPLDWEYGQDSWWRHMYDIVVNRGARMGPRLRNDPNRLEYISHASLIRFERVDDKGNSARVEQGLAGGIIPLYGCTGIIIATDRGVYAAHLWEVPTFKPIPGRANEDETKRKMFWDQGVKQFFERGNQNIVNPPSPALADMFKKGGPLETYSWIQVHLFTVAHPDKPEPLYADKVAEVEKELKKYIGDIPDNSFQKHVYLRHSPMRDSAGILDSNEFYRSRPGLQLVAWQYAPKESWPKPGEQTRQRMRAFRLWWNKRIITTRRWCDKDAKDCEAVCERERPEQDPERGTQFGWMGMRQPEASGSSRRPWPAGWNKKSRDLSVIEPRANTLARRVPRVSRNPRLPAEFTEMFPSQLTDPKTWPYGSLDWWRRMYTVATRYGATGESRELLNVDSGDDYYANHAVYRDLPSEGGAGTGGGVTPLFGCSGLVIASNKGVYTAHFWEVPTFYPPSPIRQKAKPDLYGDEKAIWDRRVRDMLDNGWKPHFENSPWGPSLKELAPEVFLGDGVEWAKIWFLHPDKSMKEITGEPRYETKWRWMLDDLREIIGVKEDHVELVTYMKNNADNVATIGSDRYYANNPGSHMFLWAFAPDAEAREPGPGFQVVNAMKVWFDRQELWYHEWCPQGKDCSAPTPEYCAHRTTPDSSKPRALAIRQESPQTTDNAPTPTSTGELLADPSDGAYLPIFWDTLSSPYDTGIDNVNGSELWWKQMYDAVTLEGAGLHLGYPELDGFARDHAVFHNFTDKAFGTGIQPMWGCTGIVVMSNKGIYVARIWEAPTFVVPYDRAHPYEQTYEEDKVWSSRVFQLIANGTEATTKEGKDIPALARLATYSSAFAPSAREWLHVQIITPATLSNSSDDRSLYFKKVAKLRSLLSSILTVDKDDVKVKTYASGREKTVSRGNSTADVDLRERFEHNPGVNMLGIQYAPKQVLRPNTTDETEVRAVRMWWDREAYFTHFWCPVGQKTIPSSDSAVSSDFRCVKETSDDDDKDDKKKEKQRPRGNKVCTVNFAPKLFPFDNMRVELTVKFASHKLKNGKIVAKTEEPISSHTFNTTLGGSVSIPASDSGMARDFHGTVGPPWDHFLWDRGYACKCDDTKGTCDLFSLDCCKDHSCLPYACNCEDPDGSGGLCWPNQNHVAHCCLERDGCLDTGLRRETGLDKHNPDMPWEGFEYALEYGSYAWPSDDREDASTQEYPPIDPFCATSVEGAYNDLTKFGKKDLIWVSNHLFSSPFFQCAFDREGTR